MPTNDLIPVNVDTALKPSGLDALRVTGGRELSGDITISGAKNAALKLMCAGLLTDQPVTLTNMPVTLSDLRTQAAVLQHMGVKVALHKNGSVSIDAAHIDNPVAPYDLVRKMRASILVLGPLVARLGHADVSLPGGCAIGTRPVDFHIDGLRAMGAEITIENGYIKASAPDGRLAGGEYTFPKVSHAGTENLLMAATLARGTTVLNNTALEPEVEDLGKMLISMGAVIDGLGTRKLTIRGVQALKGTTYACMPDRIETGTWMIASAMTGGTLRLHNTRTDFVEALVAVLKNMGVRIEENNGVVTVHRTTPRLKGIDIMTEPYPGFATDLQAQIMALLCGCDGAAMVTETIFENRFMHVPELVRMGANITVHGASAIVRGVPKLKGAEVMATDLRASVALLLAALVAEGQTTINRIYHLDRGYEDIVGKLSGVGAQVERV